MHPAYTEHMHFLNAGLQTMQHSPLNPNRGGCQGRPGAEGGHSAGKW